MTTSTSADTIVAVTTMVKGAYTMKGPDEVLTMKTLYTKGYTAWKITGILRCSAHTVKRYIENDFDVWPREQPSSALDGHGDFLLERFVRYDANADVVRQELATELGIQVSLRTVQRALKPFRERLRATRKATPRYETKPGHANRLWGQDRHHRRRGPGGPCVGGHVGLLRPHLCESVCAGGAGGMAGRSIPSWGALDRHLGMWLTTVADHRGSVRIYVYDLTNWPVDLMGETISLPTA